MGEAKPNQMQNYTMMSDSGRASRSTPEAKVFVGQFFVLQEA